MAKLVVLKKEARQVGARLIQINEECRLPDHLADNLHAQGLCVIVADGVREDPTVNDKEEERTDAKATAAKKKAADVKAKRKATKAKTKGGKPVTIDDLAGGRHTANKAKKQ